MGSGEDAELGGQQHLMCSLDRIQCPDLGHTTVEARLALDVGLVFVLQVRRGSDMTLSGNFPMTA